LTREIHFGNFIKFFSLKNSPTLLIKGADGQSKTFHPFLFLLMLTLAITDSVIVKCSHANELSPADPDWMFTKAAAIARKIYVSRSINIGVGSLKTFYGMKKRRGAHPPKFMQASGKVIREVVTQLKKNGYVENYANTEGHTFGLVLTKQGRAELDKIASRIVKERGVKA